MHTYMRACTHAYIHTYIHAYTRTQAAAATLVKSAVALVGLGMGITVILSYRNSGPPTA